jgi:hypothetical protein
LVLMQSHLLDEHPTALLVLHARPPWWGPPPCSWYCLKATSISRGEMGFMMFKPPSVSKPPSWILNNFVIGNSIKSNLNYFLKYWATLSVPLENPQWLIRFLTDDSMIFRPKVQEILNFE